MKKVFVIIFMCLVFLGTKAASYTITISGFSYAPSTLTVNVGDMISIDANSGHPVVQVDFANWSASSASPMAGGWGVQSSNYTFSVASPTDIYYICQIHGGMPMKGMISINPLSIKETKTELQNISLFPNPTQNKIQVSFGLNNSSNISIKLFNTIGQEVKVLATATNLPEGNYNYSYELPATLSTGTYFIEILSDNKKTVRKLVLTN